MVGVLRAVMAAVEAVEASPDHVGAAVQFFTRARTIFDCSSTFEVGPWRPYYTSTDRGRVLPGWLEHYNCAATAHEPQPQPPMSRFPGGNNLMLVHI
jgi:hypothetical protein